MFNSDRADQEQPTRGQRAAARRSSRRHRSVVIMFYTSDGVGHSRQRSHHVCTVSSLSRRRCTGQRSWSPNQSCRNGLGLPGPWLPLFPPDPPVASADGRGARGSSLHRLDRTHKETQRVWAHALPTILSNRGRPLLFKTNIVSLTVSTV